MVYWMLANFVVIVHFVFVLFVVFGGFLVWKWHRLIYAHLIAVVWGAAIEFRGAVCPLTPLEVDFRQKAGEAGYQGDFIENYLIPILYPTHYDRSLQLALGTSVILANLFIYAWIIRQRRR